MQAETAITYEAIFYPLTIAEKSGAEFFTLPVAAY